MTDREKAIVMAYTGTCMLTEDKTHIFYEYIQKIMGRLVYTHELPYIANTIKEKSKDDFIKLCKGGNPITKEQLNIITQELKEKVWINDDLQIEYYSNCDMSVDDRTDLIYIVSTLHNLLYECVTGEPYDYAWHWLNKVNGSSNKGCDTIYNELIGREEE